MTLLRQVGAPWDPDPESLTFIFTGSLTSPIHVLGGMLLARSHPCLAVHDRPWTCQVIIVDLYLPGQGRPIRSYPQNLVSRLRFLEFIVVDNQFYASTYPALWIAGFLLQQAQLRTLCAFWQKIRGLRPSLRPKAKSGTQVCETCVSFYSRSSRAACRWSHLQRQQSGWLCAAWAWWRGPTWVWNLAAPLRRPHRGRSDLTNLAWWTYLWTTRRVTSWQLDGTGRCQRLNITRIGQCQLFVNSKN